MSQNAKLLPAPAAERTANATAQAVIFTAFSFLLRKYTADKTKSIPEKIRKVTDVPTAGIVTKVGRKVPIMLPTVLKAPSVPTVLPLSSRLSTVYLARLGVTVPSRKSGKTKIIIHAAKAAIIRKLLFTATISSADIPTIIYFPANGIAAIHKAAISILI